MVGMDAVRVTGITPVFCRNGHACGGSICLEDHADRFSFFAMFSLASQYCKSAQMAACDPFHWRKTL